MSHGKQRGGKISNSTVIMERNLSKMNAQESREVIFGGVSVSAASGYKWGFCWGFVFGNVGWACRGNFGNGEKEQRDTQWW